MRLMAVSRSGCPAANAGKSSPVTTAFTPGMASAAEVSIDTMRA